MHNIAGKRILIVEDEYLIADDIARYFASLGAEILGPVSNVEQAEHHAEHADAAILDIDLDGASVFPVADRLAERSIPFVFFSAYDRQVIPERLNHIANLVKPADRRALQAALFPGEETAPREDENDVLALLPKLRLAARLMLPEPGAADRLVELTLRRAVERARHRPDEVPLNAWVNTILRESASRGANLLN